MLVIILLKTDVYSVHIIVAWRQNDECCSRGKHDMDSKKMECFCCAAWTKHLDHWVQKKLSFGESEYFGGYCWVNRVHDFETDAKNETTV